MWRPIRCSIAAGFVLTVVTGAMDWAGYATMLNTAWPHIWPALPLVGVFMASTSIIWLCYEAIAAFLERRARAEKQEQHSRKEKQRILVELKQSVLEAMDYIPPRELAHLDVYKEKLIALGLAPPAPTQQGDWCRYLEFMMPLVEARGIEGALAYEKKSHE